MAYGLKYYSEFKSVDNQLIRIEILQQDYEGSFEGVDLEGDIPVILSIKDKEREDSILSKGGKLNIWQTSPFKFEELFEGAETNHKIIINSDAQVIFTGFVEPALFEQELTKSNTVVTIPFSDQLQNLDNFSTDDITIEGLEQYDYYVRLIDILKAILRTTGLDLPIVVNSTLFEKDMSTSNTTMFNEVLIVKDALYQSQNLKQLLDEILRGFRISQIKGCWYINRVKDLGLTSKTYVRYNPDGTQQTVVESTPLKQFESYHFSPVYGSQSGYRELVAKFDLKDIENFVNLDNITSFSSRAETDNFPQIQINAFDKHPGIILSKVDGKIQLTPGGSFVDYDYLNSIGSTIRTRTKPFTPDGLFNDIFEVSVTYEIPLDVLNQNKNDTSNNHYLSFIGILYRPTGITSGNNSFIYYHTVDGEWYISVDPHYNVEVFEIDYKKALSRVDERTITHTISLPIPEIFSSPNEDRNHTFHILISPLRYGDNLDNEDYAAAIAVKTLIRDFKVSINEEVKPNTEFKATLNEDFKNKHEVTMFLGDLQSVNYCNTMYVEKDGVVRGQPFTYLAKTVEWSDDGVNYYDYNSKFLIDTYHIYSKRRKTITADVSSSEILESNMIIQEPNIVGSPKFFLSGMEWNLKRNYYRLLLNEYSNSEDFDIIEL